MNTKLKISFVVLLIFISIAGVIASDALFVADRQIPVDKIKEELKILDDKTLDERTTQEGITVLEKEIIDKFKKKILQEVSLCFNTNNYEHIKACANSLNVVNAQYTDTPIGDTKPR